MGYFSNGTEGYSYEAVYCDQCLHEKEFHETGQGPGCSVWAAHLLYNYEQEDNPELKAVLDLLIPREGLGNGTCSMFVEDPSCASS